MPLQPLLEYVAPEITRGQGSSPRTSTDIFSLACVAYHLLTQRSLLQCNNNLRTVGFFTSLVLLHVSVDVQPE